MTRNSSRLLVFENLSSLEKYQSTGKNNAGYVFNQQTGLYELKDLTVTPVDTFVGVGCPGAFERSSPLITAMNDLEEVTNDETLKIFRNGKNRWLRDGLLGFLGSTGLSTAYYLGMDRPEQDVPCSIVSTALITALASTGLIDYLTNAYTIMRDEN